MKTNEEFLEEIKKMIAAHQGQLDRNEFHMSITFMVNSLPRVVLFPQLSDDPDDREGLCKAIVIVGSSLPEIDSITFASDSYGATQPTKVNGEPWEYGEMGKAFQEQNENAHLVHESVMVFTLYPDGFVAASIPYIRGEDKVVVGWDDIHIFSGEDGKLTGPYYTSMEIALNGKKITSDEELAAAGEELDLSKEAQEMHLLCAAIKVSGMFCKFSAFIGCNTEAESEIMKKSMIDGPLSGSFDVYDQDAIKEIITLEEQFER